MGREKAVPAHVGNFRQTSHLHMSRNWERRGKKEGTLVCIISVNSRNGKKKQP